MGVGLATGAGAAGGLEELFTRMRADEELQQHQQALNQSGENQRQQRLLQAEQIKGLVQQRQGQEQDRRMAMGNALADQIPPETRVAGTDPAVGILRMSGRGSLLTPEGLTGPDAPDSIAAPGQLPLRAIAGSFANSPALNDPKMQAFIKSATPKQVEEAAKAKKESEPPPDSFTPVQQYGPNGNPLGPPVAFGSHSGTARSIPGMTNPDKPNPPEPKAGAPGGPEPPAARAAANKAGQDYLKAKQAGQDVQTFVDEARNSGNKLAYAYLPTEGVLTLNTSRGVTRVNMAEISQYAGAGSAADKVRAFFGKATSGQSIPPDVLNDIESLHKRITANAGGNYKNALKVVNDTYKTNFTPSNLDEAPASTSGGVKVISITPVPK